MESDDLFFFFRPGEYILYQYTRKLGFYFHGATRFQKKSYVIYKMIYDNLTDIKLLHNKNKLSIP